MAVCMSLPEELVRPFFKDYADVPGEETAFRRDLCFSSSCAYGHALFHVSLATVATANSTGNYAAHASNPQLTL